MLGGAGTDDSAPRGSPRGGDVGGANMEMRGRLSQPVNESSLKLFVCNREIKRDGTDPSGIPRYTLV